MQDFKFKNGLAPGASRTESGKGSISYVAVRGSEGRQALTPSTKTREPPPGQGRTARSFPTFEVYAWLWLRYGDDCGTGWAGFFGVALPVRTAGEETSPRLHCPLFDLRQRESS